MSDHPPPGRAAHMPDLRPIYQSETLDIVDLFDNPHVFLERGEVLFTEGDAARCMYVVKTGALQVRSGNVIYEDVGPGEIVGEMGLVQQDQPRSASVYALADSELVEIDDARFVALVGQSPQFAIAVMQTLSRRLRVMDRRYRPQR